MAVSFDLGSYKVSSVHGKGQRIPSCLPRCSYGFDNQNDQKDKVKASIRNEEPP